MANLTSQRLAAIAANQNADEVLDAYQDLALEKARLDFTEFNETSGSMGHADVENYGIALGALAKGFQDRQKTEIREGLELMRQNFLIDEDGVKGFFIHSVLTRDYQAV